MAALDARTCIPEQSRTAVRTIDTNCTNMNRGPFAGCDCMVILPRTDTNTLQYMARSILTSNQSD
jgi:hypothetical protein